MQTETIQQKAMQDIFALDEAVSQFESFGSQLDLGLPSEEDDTPKTFEDMLEVNPSDEPLEYGENFASEGDDMADKQTQKFVVDEFAKQASKLPDGEITAADITGISAVIQMTNHLTGDVRSFIDQTINHAVQAQQQQNVSEAQPNGTVAQDIAKTGDEGADAGIAEDPMGAPEGEIPSMEPIDPTAEPTLDANPVDPLAAGGDPLADLGGDTLGSGMDDLGASIDGETDPLADVGDPLAEPTGDAGIEGAEGEDPLAVEGDTAEDNGAGEEGGSELDNFLDADDEAGDAGDESKDEAPAEGDTADEGEDKKEDDTKSEEDNDEDFNFEAIATKARGLVENTETGTEDTAAAATEVVEDGKAVGEETATAQIDNPVDPAATATPTDECGEVDPTVKAESVFNNQAAKVESIVTQARMKMAADNAKAVLESYHGKRERESTIAKLESVVNNLKKNVQVESIIQKYGEASKKNAEAAKLESVQPKEEPTVEVKEEPKATFESVMASLDNALAAKKQSVRAEADKIIAEFESQHAAPAKDMRQENIDAMLESAARKVNGEKEFAGKLNSILEGVQKQKAASDAVKDIDAELNAIVESVKNA